MLKIQWKTIRFGNVISTRQCGDATTAFIRHHPARVRARSPVSNTLHNVRVIKDRIRLFLLQSSGPIFGGNNKMRTYIILYDICVYDF